MSSSMRSQISDILSTFMRKCDIAYPHDANLDEAYQRACYNDATRRGIDLTLILKHLNVGIIIGDTAYRHLKNYPTRVFIAVWIGVMFHIDDCHEVYKDALDGFSTRLMRRESQLHPLLNVLAGMSREFTQHWNTLGADTILAAELDYLSSLRIDALIKGMQIKSSTAPQFPKFLRCLSGGSKALVYQVFPPNVDVKDWIQVYPDLWDYIDHINDLFSFYKEELAGEDTNFISMTAQAKGITKIEVLRQLADDMVQGYL